MQECNAILHYDKASSARKLKKGSANLLGGRAAERFLFPFTFFEIENEFVCEASEPYQEGPIEVLPWIEYLRRILKIIQ